MTERLAVSHRSPIRRSRGGGIIVDLDAVHAGAIGEAVEQTRDLLREDAPAVGVAPGHGPADPSSEDELFAAIVADITAAGDGARPEDPVLRRLLPDASADDEAATEFRAATEAGLRRRKIAALDEVLADLQRMREGRGPVVVSPQRVRSWLTGVNDTRLALGSVLQIGADDDLMGELDDYLDDDVTNEGDGERTLRAYRIVVYDILTGMLDKIVTVVSS